MQWIGSNQYEKKSFENDKKKLLQMEMKKRKILNKFQNNCTLKSRVSTKKENAVPSAGWMINMPLFLKSVH